MTKLSTVELRQFTQWLWHEIPITRAMDIHAITFDKTQLAISAGIAANLNHKQTAFGGSISATLTVACWGRELFSVV